MEYTFTIIKPYAVEHGYVGAILSKINKGGFRISAMKFIQLTESMAQKFYEIHKDMDFYNELIKFISSGPVVIAILEKENAIEDFRTLIGATDPTKAKEGSIRHMFGQSISKNAVHGSDSFENAVLESGFFFSMNERF